MDLQKAGFPETQRKPVRKARVTEVDYCGFLGDHGYQRISHCFLETVASVTRSNPAGNALQHYDVDGPGGVREGHWQSQQAVQVCGYR